MDHLRQLFRVQGEPEYIRSDNGPEFIATAVKDRLTRTGVKTLYIEPCSPWQNAYSESFNSRFEDELNREVSRASRRRALRSSSIESSLVQPGAAAQLARLPDVGGVCS